MIAVWLNTRIGKKATTQILLAVAIGAGSLWFTLRPELPYLQLLSTGIVGLGLQGAWMTFYTMTGDVCEEDELKTGLRREGIFSSMGGFALKWRSRWRPVLGGAMLNMVGFDAAKAAEAGCLRRSRSTPKLLMFPGRRRSLSPG